MEYVGDLRAHSAEYVSSCAIEWYLLQMRHTIRVPSSRFVRKGSAVLHHRQLYPWMSINDDYYYVFNDYCIASIKSIVTCDAIAFGAASVACGRFYYMCEDDQTEKKEIICILVFTCTYTHTHNFIYKIVIYTQHTAHNQLNFLFSLSCFLFHFDLTILSSMCSVFVCVFFYVSLLRRHVCTLHTYTLPSHCTMIVIVIDIVIVAHFSIPNRYVCVNISHSRHLLPFDRRGASSGTSQCFLDCRFRIRLHAWVCHGGIRFEYASVTYTNTSSPNGNIGMCFDTRSCGRWSIQHIGKWVTVVA